MPIYGQGSESIIYASDHRPVKTYGLYVKANDDLIDWWKSPSAVTNLVSRLQDDYTKGFRRFCLYLPGGGNTSSLANPNHWFTMPSWKRNDLVSILKPWLMTHPDAFVFVYSGLKFNNALYKLTLTTVDSGTAVYPDLTISSHAEYFRQNWTPWFGLGIKGLIFELPYTTNISGIREYDGTTSLVNLAYAYWMLGIRVGGDAFPTILSGLNYIPNESLITKVFWTDFYPYVSGIAGFSAWSFNTTNTEIGLHLLPEYSLTISDGERIAEQNIVLWPWGGLLDDTAINIDNPSTPTIETSRTYAIESEKGSDPIEGFGVPRYVEQFSGAIGDSIDFNYERCNIVCKANSVNGVFTFHEPLTKFVQVTADIINPSFKNTGLPHIVTEDTMEWVNSGLPSSLSQVMHSNVVNLGIHFERKYPGRQTDLVGPYQARYTSPIENTWYDKFNSTVDYDLLVNYANIGSHMPYATCVLHVQSRREVWVGGPDGVLVIDVDSKSVSSLNIDRRRSLNIKDLKLFNDQVYILDEHGLYIYDLVTSEIERDSGLGLPTGLFALTVMLNTNLVIGGSNGIYARKKNQESWQRVVESDQIDILSNPDACFAVEKRTKIWYSTDGFSWKNIGSMPSDIEVNQIEKHRSQLYIGTNRGLYEDNGSFYGGSVAIALVDVLNDPSESVKLVINDIASSFGRCIFGLSDGRHLIQTTSFAVEDTSALGSIHRTLVVDSDIWLFGYDMYRSLSENVIRKLATGSEIGGSGQVFDPSGV